MPQTSPEVQSLCENARKCMAKGEAQKAGHFFAQAFSLSPHIFPEILLDFEKAILNDPGHIGIRLAYAGFQLESGLLDGAVLELEEALEVNPKSIEIYNLLGKFLIKQEKVDETILLLEKSVQAGVEDVSLSEILAGAYLEKGRVQEAITFYNQVLKVRPNDKNILRTLGELYTRLEDYNRAANCYRDMFSEDPQVSYEVIQRLENLLKKREGSVALREILADIYMKSLKPKDAVQKLKEIVRMDSLKAADVVVRLKNVLKNYPGHLEASEALGEILSFEGNFTEAVEIFRDLAKSRPEFIDKAIKGYRSILEICPEQVLAGNYLAESYLLKNDLELALDQYRDILDHDPQTAEQISIKAREILRKNPQMVAAHLVLGKAYLIKGDLPRALLEAEGVLNIDKKHSGAYLLMGEVYNAMKMGRKAAEVLRTALQLDPYNRAVLEKYREAKEKEVDVEIEEIKNKLIENQHKVSLRVDLAKLYLQKNMEDESIRQLQFALKDPGRAPTALNLLGCIYRGQGRFDLALAQFSRALELGAAESIEARRNIKFNLGTAYEGQGHIKKALAIYESILQENIDFENLKKKVKYFKNTNLQSMRNALLLAVIKSFGKNDIFAVWGREAKTNRSNRKEEVSLSFGQSHNTAGYELYMKGMHKAALEEFQLAIQLDSKFDTALNNWAISLAQEGRFLEAKHKLLEAVDLNPLSAIIANNLGVVCLLLGQFDPALQELEKAYGLDNESNAIAINLADIYYIKGRVEDAIKLYKQIGKYDMLSEVAANRLQFKTC